MKAALIQINPATGDVSGNLRAVETIAGRAAGVDLVVFPAWALTGWRPLDLARSPAFQRAQAEALDGLRGLCPGVPLVMGHEADGAGAVSVLADGKRRMTIRRGSGPATFEADGQRIALALSWDDLEALPKADLAVLCAPEPFRVGRPAERIECLRTVASRAGAPVAWCNLVGGAGEHVFGGGSLVVLPDGDLAGLGPRFQEGVLTVDLDSPAPVRDEEAADLEMLEEALMLGLADFARKGGFSKAVLGLSGGIDSAVVAALAARSLGPENVTALVMPTCFTRNGSASAATEVAQRLGIRSVVLSIEKLRLAYAEALEPLFAGTESGTAEENVQARIRASLIMAHANKFGSMPLATGNRSELAVGYCTLYGDLAGALAAIGDVPKTVVYRLAERLNRDQQLIPPFVIERAPSAELRPEQTDQDDLPPYEVLDQILALHLDRGLDAEQIVEAGLDPTRVADVVARVQRADFKRRQAPPVLRVFSAEGAWPRLPLAAHLEPTLPDQETT